MYLQGMKKYEPGEWGYKQLVCAIMCKEMWGAAVNR